MGHNQLELSRLHPQRGISQTESIARRYLSCRTLSQCWFQKDACKPGLYLFQQVLRRQLASFHRIALRHRRIDQSQLVSMCVPCRPQLYQANLSHTTPQSQLCPSHPTVSLALVAEPVRLSVRSHLRLVERDGLGQWHPQHVQVRFLGEGQPAPHPDVDLHRLGEQPRPSALRLHPPLA